MDGGQAHVAGVDAISSLLFQVVQELEDHLDGKVFEREVVDRPMWNRPANERSILKASRYASTVWGLAFRSLPEVGHEKIRDQRCKHRLHFVLLSSIRWPNRA